MQKIIQLSSLLLLLWLIPSTALASNELNDGLTMSTEMKSDTKETYYITLKQPARISLQISSEISKLRLDVNEVGGEQLPVDPKYLSNGKKGHPEIARYEFDLAAGQYAVHLTSRYGSTNGTVSVLYSTQDVPTTQPIIQLPFNKKANGFIVQRSSGDYYEITVPQDGYVTLQLDGMLRKETSYELLDINNNRLHGAVKKSSTTSAARFNERYALSQGTYLLRVYNRLADVENNTGYYALNTLFSASPGNDIEPNNTFNEAESIYFGQNKKGFVGMTDTTDYFAINVAKASNINVNITSHIPQSTTVKLFNSSQTQIDTKTHNTNETAPHSFNFSFQAKPGTYYVNVSMPKGLTSGGEYTATVLGQGITTFADYKMNEYWTNPFAWGFDKKIIQGVPATNRLSPYNILNEAQLLAMTFRYMFNATDATNGAWYQTYYNIAYREGIYVNNQPNLAMRRGDAAKMLAYLYTGDHMSEHNAIAWMRQENLTTASNATTFNANGAMTRGHNVTFMHRAYEQGLVPFNY